MSLSTTQTLGATILFVFAYVLALYSNTAYVAGNHETACNFGMGCVALLVASGVLFASRKSSPGVAVDTSAVTASS